MTLRRRERNVGDFVARREREERPQGVDGVGEEVQADREDEPGG